MPNNATWLFVIDIFNIWTAKTKRISPEAQPL